MSKALEIKGFPNYFITDNGSIYSRKTGRFIKIKPAKDKKGYLRVSFWEHNKRITKKVHRLVAEAFIPNPENKPQVNHINGVKTDNNFKNLEWNTASENMQHSHRVLGIKSSNYGKFGKDNHSSKAVVQIKDDIIIAEFGSMREAERKTGIKASNIGACCKGQYKQIFGYQWKYKSELLNIIKTIGIADDDRTGLSSQD